MARLLIQSGVTWEFIHSHPQSGDVSFTPSLLTAMRYGVVEDMEQAAQLIEDHCDRGTALVIDLDGEF